MASDNTASIITLHQPAKRAPLSPAVRARNYRLRKKAKDTNAVSRDVTAASLPVTPRVTSLAQALLVTAAIGLAGVGVTMNGWFARSLGSSDVAGWLFLAIGVASDVAALAIPSRAAGLWHAHRRGIAAAAWGAFAVTFIFAVTAGIGFASLNISDVTTARASRVTPAVTMAQTALTDAMVARDRECKGGVGKFCREREAAVNDRRAALDVAVKAVEQTGDPQTQAAIHIVAWLSAGHMTPTENDFAMLRLALLALLPQIGGILMMIGRAR